MIASLISAGFLPTAASGAAFRLASLAPQDSAWGRLIQELSSEIEQMTEGAVRFQLYLGGKLGDEARVVKKLGKGLDGAFFTGQGVGIIAPVFRVLELPFLCETYEQADKLRNALWPIFVEEFERKTDFVLLGPGETGMIHLFGKKPIASVEELRAAKVWVWEGDAVASNTFKAFGVSPRPLDVLTVVQQLKAGGIDTVYNSPAGAVALGWIGDLRYVSARPFAYASGGFVLTKKAWASIPENHRERVRARVMDYGERIIQQVRKDNDAAFARLIAPGGGLESVSISEAKYQSFQRVGVGAWKDLASAIDAGMYLERAKAVLAK